jgi:hypothetical protein
MSSQIRLQKYGITRIMAIPKNDETAVFHQTATTFGHQNTY